MSHICEYCGYKFDRKYNMQRHIQSQHKRIMDEEETENSGDENPEESEDENSHTVDTDTVIL